MQFICGGESTGVRTTSQSLSNANISIVFIMMNIKMHQEALGITEQN